MREYKVENYSSKTELKDAVLCDDTLSDMDKLRLIFSVSKDDLKMTNVQLYYAILAVLDKNTKVMAPPEYFTSFNRG